jgi:hypothetical protein
MVQIIAEHIAIARKGDAPHLPDLIKVCHFKEGTH